LNITFEEIGVLKIMEEIQLNMEDGQFTMLVLLNFSQSFYIVTHGLLLCKLKNLQNYLDGARMLVDPTIAEWYDPVYEMW
jgi:hypothetical protein